MKTRSILLGIASLAAGLSSALAQTAVTDPVGYITHSIAAPAATGGKADTLMAVTLVNKKEYAGAATAVAGSTITVASAPTGVAVGQCLELSDGSNEGWWSTVTAVAGTTITVQDAIPAGTAATVKFSTRLHNTIGSYLGVNNSAGLDSGLGLDEADEVQILNIDPVTKARSISAYFYATTTDGAPANGWYDPSPALANDVVIYPGSAILVRRKTAGALNLVSVGHVKTTNTQIDIIGSGDNWVTGMRATGVSLGSSGFNTGVLATGVDQGTGLDDADEVQFLAANQNISAYFAVDPIATGAPAGFYDPSPANADSVMLTESHGVIVRRKVATDAIFTTPRQPIAN